MASHNHVSLLGYLGDDPELRYTQGGAPVCNIRIATNERWRGADGQERERVDWHRITVWGKQGESCGKHLRKGRLVLVTGRLHHDEYEDRDGVKRWATTIVADRVVFVGGDPARIGESTAKREPSFKRSAGAPAEPSADDYPAPGDDDIPF